MGDDNIMGELGRNLIIIIHIFGIFDCLIPVGRSSVCERKCIGSGDFVE